MRNPNGHPVLAQFMDLTMRPLVKIRNRVVPHARGRILEVGAGTGMNLPRYDAASVDEYVGIEPDPHMRRRAAPRVEAVAFPARLVAGGAEAMPFDDAKFDEVVITFVLCTIPDPAAALAEIHRVLVPGGIVHFAEHTASDHRAGAWVQRALDPLWTRLAGGCHLDRDPVAMLTSAGFEVEDLHGHGRGPLNLTPIHRGRARRT